jgi:hypothetical protein
MQNELASKIVECFKNGNWPYFRDEDDGFILAQSNLNNGLGACRISYFIFPGKILIVGTPMINLVHVSARSWKRMAQLANEINSRILVGRFCVVREEGCFQYEIGIFCPEADLTEAVFLCSAIAVIHALDDFSQSFLDICQNDSLLPWQAAKEGFLRRKAAEEKHDRLSPEQYAHLFVPPEYLKY